MDSACCCRPKAGRPSSCCRSPSASARMRPCSPPSTGCCCASCRSPIPTRSSGSNGAAGTRCRTTRATTGRARPARMARRCRATFSYPMFQHFRSANQTMTDLAGSRPKGITVTIDGRAETASALLVTGNYHGLLGVTARIGRTLAPDDDNPAAPAVATLSDRYWQTRFAADPGVLGKTISINKVPVTIVGVTPAVIYRNAACQRPPARLHDAAQARRSNQRRRSAHERCDRVVGAGDGPPQTRHHARAGEGEPGTGIPASGARRIGRLSCGGIRQGKKPVSQPGTDRRPSPARRLGKPRHVRRRRESDEGAQPSQCCGGAGTDARLRERGESPALPGNGASAGNFRPAVDRRDALAACSPAAHGEPAAGGHGWHRRPCAGALGTAAAAGARRHIRAG